MIRNLNEAAALLRQENRFLILSHRRPDGDTAGSSAALCRALRAMGKDAWILENPELTPRCTPFWTGLTCATIPEGAVPVSVDVSSLEMLPKNAESLAGSIRLCLDHHSSNPGYAEISVICPDFAAAGELIWFTLDKFLK